MVRVYTTIRGSQDIRGSLVTTADRGSPVVESTIAHDSKHPPSRCSTLTRYLFLHLWTYLYPSFTAFPLCQSKLCFFRVLASCNFLHSSHFWSAWSLTLQIHSVYNQIRSGCTAYIISPLGYGPGFLFGAQQFGYFYANKCQAGGSR